MYALDCVCVLAWSINPLFLSLLLFVIATSQPFSLLVYISLNPFFLFPLLLFLFYPAQVTVLGTVSLSLRFVRTVAEEVKLFQAKQAALALVEPETGSEKHERYARLSHLALALLCACVFAPPSFRAEFAHTHSRLIPFLAYFYV